MSTDRWRPEAEQTLDELWALNVSPDSVIPDDELRRLQVDAILRLVERVERETMPRVALCRDCTTLVQAARDGEWVATVIYDRASGEIRYERPGDDEQA